MIRALKYLRRIWIYSGAGFIIVSPLLFIIACDNGADGDPVGPSNISNNAKITVTPAAITITKNGTVTFTSSGGTAPISWSVDRPNYASIDSSTGGFVAGNKAGEVKVTATDANGSVGTSTVTISDKSLVIIPVTAQVGKGNAQVFTVTGATAPVFWSVANTTIGSIDVATGIFTAGVTIGSTTVTVLDADGDTASASVSVVSNSIVVAPAAAGPYAAGGTQAFTATTNGVAGTYMWTLSGEGSDYTGGTLAVQATPTVGTTLTFTQPTAGEGNQTLIITATDGNGDSGTSTVTLTALSS